MTLKAKKVHFETNIKHINMKKRVFFGKLGPELIRKIDHR
jgi:hypothetical protein